MIRVNIYKQVNYPISAVRIKKFLQKFFTDHGIVSDSEVGVSFVGKSKMKTLCRKYYKKDNRLHNVFSFVESEVVGFNNKSENVINLGEIVVCFPVVIDEANSEGKLIEEKVLELIQHSALHLLGIHHQE